VIIVEATNIDLAEMAASAGISYDFHCRSSPDTNHPRTRQTVRTVAVMIAEPRTDPRVNAGQANPLEISPDYRDHPMMSAALSWRTKLARCRPVPMAKIFTYMARWNSSLQVCCAAS
jgi:hypothetical protein